MKRVFCSLLLFGAVFIPGAITLMASPATAEVITVYGGPTYTSGVGGFKTLGGGLAGGVNDAGTAVGTNHKFDASAVNLGYRAVRWDGSGMVAVELGNLGTDSSGATFGATPRAINDAGTAVGHAEKYVGSGFNLGDLAVRWQASGTAATELGHLGADPNGRMHGDALDINDAGAAVGWASKYVGTGINAVNKGTRAVRWQASGTAATELGHLGTNPSGTTYGIARAINDAGTAVGKAEKFDGSGVTMGYRAVRWDGSGTSATELGHLGTDTNGVTDSEAYAVNDTGAIVGESQKFDASGAHRSARAVRWDASGTTATELGNLGTDSNGSTFAFAGAINTAGTAFGSALKFDGSGANLGDRAVRWDISGTSATELGNLGTNANGYTDSNTDGVNDAGTVVGWAEKYDASGTLLGIKAVYWRLDALAVDLNTLIDPASGWTLNYASAISDTGWIGGSGDFDPDGPGGQEPYHRLFLMHVPATAVPEPAEIVPSAIALLGLVALGWRSRR